MTCNLKQCELVQRGSMRDKRRLAPNAKLVYLFITLTPGVHA